MKGALRDCLLVLADAAINCIEVLAGPLAESKIREGEERRAAAKRARDLRRSAGPGWLQEAQQVRKP